jgi:hypothetical protein
MKLKILFCLGDNFAIPFSFPGFIDTRTVVLP